MFFFSLYIKISRFISFSSKTPLYILSQKNSPLIFTNLPFFLSLSRLQKDRPSSMAANKFATILHRNTNRVTVLLVYAMLEWILIVLLLLNSLFSYIIVKFADYVGLKRPCFLCSRLDHLFEPGLKNNSYRDLVCEVHASEISKLGYCLTHRKLAESQDMCLDCSSCLKSYCTGFSKEIDFFPLVKQIGMCDVDVDSKCSCCGASLNGKITSPYFLIKPSWDLLDCNLKGKLIAEGNPDDNIDQSDRNISNYGTDKGDGKVGIDQNGVVQLGCFVRESLENSADEREEGLNSSFSLSHNLDLMVGEDENNDLMMGKNDGLCSSMADLSKEMDGVVCSTKDALPRIGPQHLEFVIDREDYQLIPVEFTHSATMKNQGYEEVNQDFVMEFGFPGEKGIHEARDDVLSIEETCALLSACEHSYEAEAEVVESMEIGANDVLAEATQTASTDGNDGCKKSSTVREMGDDNLAWQEDSKTWSDDTDAEVSIGTEIPEHKHIDEYQNDEHYSVQCPQEDPSTSCTELLLDDTCGGKQAPDEGVIEFRTISVKTSAQALNTHLSLYSGLNDIEEHKISDTPTSIESFQHMYKKLFLLEKRELGTEESCDGSVFSEMDYGEGILTVEKLKSVLRAEKKALNALYVELEEERSASAVAANQTMAMINRLQEEKAAMQMEALQYQRMMDEQSEYDQEALQLLNEILVKREKENLELEKDLEIYRRKVRDYEAKERMMMSRKDSSSRSRTSSTYCSNVEDSDGPSIDSNHEGKKENGLCSPHESSNSNTNTPAAANAVAYLEESLDNFEEERLQILEQLKVLEEKLFTLSDEEDQHFEDVKVIEENDNGYHEYSNVGNGVTNGYFKEMNGELYMDRRIDLRAKKLLPLFNDVISAETDYEAMNGNEQGFKLQNKKLSIEEEVDDVYERLQALESDRKFLKHCLVSLSKGDKGVHLLQEILQHLRELRSLEHGTMNTCEGTS